MVSECKGLKGTFEVIETVYISIVIYILWWWLHDYIQVVNTSNSPLIKVIFILCKFYIINVMKYIFFNFREVLIIIFFKFGHTPPAGGLLSLTLGLGHWLSPGSRPPWAPWCGQEGAVAPGGWQLLGVGHTQPPPPKQGSHHTQKAKPEKMAQNLELDTRV